jgi:hypothetical protein
MPFSQQDVARKSRYDRAWKMLRAMSCAHGSIVSIADVSAEFRRGITQAPGGGLEGQLRACIANLITLEAQVGLRRQQVEAQKTDLQGRVSAGAL